MTETQILVLFVTFLVASLLVVPLVYIGFKKDAKRKDRERKQLRQAVERQQALELESQQSEGRARANKLKALSVKEYKALRPRFSEIRKTIYQSAGCPSCQSETALLKLLDSALGVLTVECAVCHNVRKVFPLNKDRYCEVRDELTEIVRAYHRVRQLAPEYTGLGLSFPKPDASYSG